MQTKGWVEVDEELLAQIKRHSVSTELQKVILIAQRHILPQKLAPKNSPKMT